MTSKNEKIDKGIYETLIRRGALITGKYKVSKYLLFSFDFQYALMKLTLILLHLLQAFPLLPCFQKDYSAFAYNRINILLRYVLKAS